MRLILEMNGGLLQFSETLDETLFVRIDEDVVDRRILQKGFDRAEADHLVDNFLCKCLGFLLIERQPLGADIIIQVGAHFPYKVLAWKLFKRGEIEFIDDAGVELELLVQQRRALCYQLVIELFLFDGSTIRLNDTECFKPDGLRRCSLEKSSFVTYTCCEASPDFPYYTG